jgi:hypothetical protein
MWTPLKYQTMQDHLATTHPLLDANDHTESKHLHRIGEFRGNQQLIIVDPTLSLPVPMGTFEDYLEKIDYIRHVTYRCHILRWISRSLALVQVLGEHSKRLRQFHYQ